MRVLALDAATEACSVALLSGEEEIARIGDGSRSQGERILELVDAVLAAAGVTLSQLDGIAASIGPGAFTGVRISVAVAQGLAFGAGLPVVPITTLEALAFDALTRRSPVPGGVAPGGVAPGAVARDDPSRMAIACLDARMGEVYVGGYVRDARRGLETRLAPRLCAPQALVLPPGRLVGIGRGFGAYPALAGLPGLELAPGGAQALPDARAMARLGMARLVAGEGLDAGRLEPLYLRDRVALTEAERHAARAPGD